MCWLRGMASGIFIEYIRRDCLLGKHYFQSRMDHLFSVSSELEQRPIRWKYLQIVLQQQITCKIGLRWKYLVLLETDICLTNQNQLAFHMVPEAPLVTARWRWLTQLDPPNLWGFETFVTTSKGMSSSFLPISASSARSANSACCASSTTRARGASHCSTFRLVNSTTTFKCLNQFLPHILKTSLFWSGNKK